MRKVNKSYIGWYFLGIILAIYFFLFFINRNIFINSLNKFFSIFVDICPMLFIVFILMFIINYFMSPKWLVKHLNEKNKIKRWFIAIFAGVISTGPIYMWYPMLSDLKEKGIDSGLIATFLYARALKPALLPLMILYFGIFYTILFSCAIIVFSVVQGIIINKMEVK